MEKHKLSSISKEELKAEAEKLCKLNELEYSEDLKIILATSETLKLRKETDIRFSEPILKQNSNAVFFPHTINVIQGQAGVHKSRLVENICSALLKLPYNNNELLGFIRTNYDANYTVVYVDTERNLSEQFPYAIQSILVNAGYDKKDNPPNFKYISLLQINRKDRFKALESYLKYIKNVINNPLFIVLDVSTDCIEDFNRTDKSMELIDLMNMAINEYNVIFLCLIHENPGSEKARGHFGTELMNKASTVMQIGFEKDANHNNTEIIKVKYIKCRSTMRHLPFFVKYSAEKKGLVLADVTEINNAINSRKHKATDDEISELVILYLGDGSELSRREFIGKLCSELNTKERTIETRLKEIIDSEFEFLNENSEKFKLNKESKNKEIIYKLIPCII